MKSSNYRIFKNIFWFQFKKLFTSLSSIYFLLIPISLILTIGVIFPYIYVFRAMIGASIVYSTLFIYGVFFYNLKNSTIYQEINIRNLKREKLFNFYGSLFLLIFLFNIFYLISIILLFLLFSEIGLAINIHSNPIPIYPIFEYNGLRFLNQEFTFFSIDWGIVFYYLILLTISIFIISFIFEKISPTIKGYMIFASSYFLLNIIFGGMILTKFLEFPPGYYFSEFKFYNGVRWTSIEGWENFFIIDSSSITYTVNENGQYIINLYPSSIVQSGWGDPTEIENIAKYSGLNTWSQTKFLKEFESFTWIISQFFPLYSLNMFISSSFFNTTYNSLINENSINLYIVNESFDSVEELVSIIFDNYENVGENEIFELVESATFNFKYFKVNNLEWLFIIIEPYLLIIFYLLISFVVYKNFKI